MKKILLLIILGSLVTGCQTNQNNSIIANNKFDNKVKNIQVVVEYQGYLRGENRGVEIKQTPAEKADGMPLRYSIDLNISPNTKMADFIPAFHKKTGLDISYPMSAGAPPNRHTTQIAYYHEVNGQLIDPRNAEKTLTEWGIKNNSTVVIEVAGGGAVD